MLIALDVYYEDDGARVAAIAFETWSSDSTTQEWVTMVSEVAEYEPGEFYRRELPCLLRALQRVPEVLEGEPVTAVIIDGHVWLNSAGRRGLGAYLFDELGGDVPIVGVAKNPFRDNDASRPVTRGGSKRPLYVSSEGMDVEEASSFVAGMHGPHRVPTLLRRVDELSRG